MKGFVAVCFCCRCYGHEGNTDFFRLYRNLESILQSSIVQAPGVCQVSVSDCNLNRYSIEAVTIAPNMLRPGIRHEYWGAGPHTNTKIGVRLLYRMLLLQKCFSTVKVAVVSSRVSHNAMISRRCFFRSCHIASSNASIFPRGMRLFP